MSHEESPQILIVSTKTDLATDAVVLALAKLNASFYRLNTEDLPLQATSSFTISDAAKNWTWNKDAIGKLEFYNLNTIWFRRLRLPELSDSMPEAYSDYCLREVEWFLRGALASHDVSWMSHPSDIQQAEAKIFQLVKAKQVGFDIPETLISNDAEEVKSFFHRMGGDIICKPLRLGYFDYGDKCTCVFTSMLNEEDLTDIAGIRVAPVIYQQHIKKARDIRVTIVGNRIFSAEINSQVDQSSMVDWRRSDVDLPYCTHKLPRTVEEMCFRLLDALNLKFGAIDLVLSTNGQYLFIEVNPNGQWLWLEDKLGFPITLAVAEWIVAQSCKGKP